MNEITPEKQTPEVTPKIIYVLIIVSSVIPIIGLISVIMAYINKKDAPDWLESHYQFQIRTFWIGLLLLIVGIALTIIIIGFFVILFLMVWTIIRGIKGMAYLDRKEAHPTPKSWMF